MSETRLVVEPSVDDDLPFIVEHYGTEGVSPWNPFSSVDRLKDIPHNGLIVARVDGKYAGFLYWFSGTGARWDINVKRFACIAEVMVREEHWGKKIGFKLLREAFRVIDKEGFSAVYTQVPEGNNALKTEYERIGFTTFGRTLQMRYLYPTNLDTKKKSNDEALYLPVFLVELREQCRMFLTAFSEVEDLIAEGPPIDLESKRRFNARIWSRIQAVLSAGSIITKILWLQPTPKKDGSDKKSIQRGREIRQILKMQATRSLFPSSVRNMPSST